MLRMISPFHFLGHDQKCEANDQDDGTCACWTAERLAAGSPSGRSGERSMSKRVRRRQSKRSPLRYTRRPRTTASQRAARQRNWLILRLRGALATVYGMQASAYGALAMAYSVDATEALNRLIQEVKGRR